MSGATEPAIKSYFFGKGYSDLRNTIVDCWQLNWASAEHFFNSARSTNFFYGAGWIAAGISVVVFGTAFFLIVSALHIAIIFLVHALFYLAFTITYLAERAYLLWRKIAVVCPRCHKKCSLPDYYCSKCSSVHRQLIPSSYGIFHHQCKCGEKLPSTFFANRRRLQASCKGCELLLTPEQTEARKLFVHIVGGPSVGKTCYFFALMWKLVEEKLPQLGLGHRFVEPRDQNFYERIRKSIRQGRAPGKTVEKLPPAFNLLITRKDGENRLLYIYDPAGEAFADLREMVLHKYQEYASGCIFLIDPFSISSIKEDYQTQLPAVLDALRPGSSSLEDTLSYFILSLEEHYNLAKTDHIHFPLAVVINKIDAFDLEVRIGNTMVKDLAKTGDQPLGIADVRNDFLRQQLESWGYGGLVQRLESRFTKVRYFTCSSIGRLPDASGRQFEPYDVLEPLLWIFHESDRGFLADSAS